MSSSRSSQVHRLAAHLDRQGVPGADVHDVLVQRDQRRLVVAQRGDLLVDLLHRRQEPQPGEGVDGEERQDRAERGALRDQHREDDQQHPAEGHPLQQVARRGGDHRAGRGDPRHPPRRDLEAAHVARLEPEELHVLDAGGRLLGDLVALGVGGEADLAVAGEILARDQEDQPVARHQHHRGAEGDPGLQRDQEGRDEERDDEVREQVHRRHERLARRRCRPPTAPPCRGRRCGG